MAKNKTDPNANDTPDIPDFENQANQASGEPDNGGNATLDSGETPQGGADNGNTPQKKGGKVKLRCEAMKSRKIFLNDGSIGEFDSDGYIEVSAGDAARLLKIPSYEKA